jgi:hypothetical protein
MLRGFSVFLIDTSGLLLSRASSGWSGRLADMMCAIVTWPGCSAIVSVHDELY